MLNNVLQGQPSRITNLINKKENRHPKNTEMPINIKLQAMPGVVDNSFQLVKGN